MKRVWNFGDVNLVDGGVVVSADNIGYYINTCNAIPTNDYENQEYCCTRDYLYYDDLKDIDSWINREDVCSCMGYSSDIIEQAFKNDDCDVIAQYAADVIAYYGTQETYFSIRNYTYEEAMQFMTCAQVATDY